MFSFKRPPLLPLQQWSQKDQFHISDVTRDKIPEIMYQLQEDFFRDEPIFKAVRLCEDPESIQEAIEFWTEVLDVGISLMAVDEKTNRVVGFNCLVVEQKDDEQFAFKGRVLSASMAFITYCNSLVNMYDQYGVDKYMEGVGLSVRPTYRRQGLGTELLRARLGLCGALGVRVIKTMFSATQSQNLAKKLGYEVIAEVSYEEFQVDAKIEGAESCLVMALEVPSSGQKS